MIFLLFRIRNAHTGTGWNVPIPMPVWIVSAEKGYLLSEQKKFQNKSKNIDEVYQSVFRTGSLSFVMFWVKFIIHQKVLYDIFFMKKL